MVLQVEVRIKGIIAEEWSEWFEGLAITHADDETVLCGVVVDQAALYGLLAKLRDLGLSLVSVTSETVAIGVADRDEARMESIAEAVDASRAESIVEDVDGSH